MKSTQWFSKKGFGITETNGSRVLTGIKQPTQTQWVIYQTIYICPTPPVLTLPAQNQINNIFVERNKKKVKQ
jgi:hypothetical protein